MKSPMELRRHDIDWNAQRCRKCDHDLTTIAANNAPCSGKSNKPHYFTPFVKNITVKQPNLCITHYFDWNDKCTQCGIHEDDA